MPSALITAPLELAAPAGPRIVVDPPVVLAPMAGITNIAFRRLCREFLESAIPPEAQVRADVARGLFVSEMITTRALVERDAKTLRLIAFGPEESPRSLQLYGVDPAIVGRAAAMAVEENLADHIDLNFGCPVAKVTRKGGGAALPWRIELFADIVAAAVRGAGGQAPVTVKMRMGIDEDHLTFREAALRAQDAGAAYVALHGRTAAQHYSGSAHWEPIAELVELLDIPVLGNGDIWEADDALRMVERTGCAGVVVGRGCLGRPWLFADLAAAFAGRPERLMPTLATIAPIMRRHAQLLAEWMGEDRGLPDFRKHVAWYLKGFSVGASLRNRFASVSSLQDLDDCIGMLDRDQEFPRQILGQPRGRTTAMKSVALPEGWLASRGERSVPVGAEVENSGG
ncbi:MAG: tRNA dihydrouridine synthase DusB [Jatrophihabitantaceae bacterium]|nr:tRNA dihydrouridine synthase DusB [Jatrophihabitantaceae bacterium]